MPARWVIHVVGPVHSRAEDRTELLASCYREALRVADELGARLGRLPGRVRRHLRMAARRRRRRRRADRLVDADRGHGRALRAVQRRGARGVPAGLRRALNACRDALRRASIDRRLNGSSSTRCGATGRTTSTRCSGDRGEPRSPAAVDVLGRPDPRRTASFLAGPVEKWDAGEEFTYLIVDDAGDRVLGGGGLHRRLGADALEIGYWLRADATGRGVDHRGGGGAHRRGARARRHRAGGDPLRRGQRAQRGRAPPARLQPRRIETDDVRRPPSGAGR